jgi:TPR repeat protein
MKARTLLLATTFLAACRSEGPPPSAAQLETACGAGNASACAALARHHLSNGKIEKEKAAAAYARGCDAGDARLCNAAAEAYFWKDRPRAERLRRKACDLGSGEGCFVGASYERERGDNKTAGAMEGRGIAMYTKACGAGDAEACFGLGRFVSRDDEPRAEHLYREAIGLWQRRCDGGSAHACHRLGAVYAEEVTALHDANRARPFLESACAQGIVESCGVLGRLLLGSGAREERPRAASLLEQACRAGLEPRLPCREAAFLYVEGAGVAVDKPRAAVLLQNGCDLGDEWCCFKLGTMLVEGDGVPPDPARGADLTRSAIGLQFRVVEVERRRTMVDPGLAAFGIPEASIPPVTAAPGQELIRVAIEARRTTDRARLPIRRMYLIDEAGRRYENHAAGDDPLGGKPLERRAFMFKVPAGTRPIKLKFELGTVTLDLPRS